MKYKTGRIRIGRPMVVLLGSLFVMGQGVTAAPATVATFGSGRDITVNQSALYPETIAAGADDRHFLLGSFREGAIYEVDMTGNARRLVQDKALHSVLGIFADKRHNRLYATNSDLGASLRSSADTVRRLAVIGVYDLTTGAVIEHVNLGALLPDSPHLLNGITGDDLGNIYVTDSFSPVIYKIDQHGKASVFLRSRQFEGPGINLNGIVYHPDGYLLVIKKSDGSLFRIPLHNPRAFARIKMGAAYAGGDGVALVDHNTVLIVANQTEKVRANSAYLLASRDGWKTADELDSHPLGDVYPTTGLIQNHRIYVLSSHLNRLIQASPQAQAQLREKAVVRSLGKVSPSSNR